MKIVPVRWIDEVLDLALERPISPRPAVAQVTGAEVPAEAAHEADKGAVLQDVKH